VHQHDHPVDQPPEVIVEVLDGVRDQAKRRVAVLADLRERKPPPSLGLGPLTSVLSRLVIVLVLVVVLVIVIVIVMFVVRHSRSSVEIGPKQTTQMIDGNLGAPGW
jgi:hypothetical protein